MAKNSRTKLRPSADKSSTHPSAESSPPTGMGFYSSLGDVLFLALAAIAVLYAFMSGLRTVSDFDIGWQLASGRWVAQHHQVFSTEIFSFTAFGQPWIYPVLSCLLFYAAYLLGGYALLSILGGTACAGTVALLLRRGTVTSAAIAIVAMVSISYRAIPRAEMFTVVLFAAYLSILWENFQSGSGPTWLLPLLMAAWVNLHLGFVAGLALVLAFAGIDGLEILFGEVRRRKAIQRLQLEWRWFALTFAATLLNPWGWNIYEALIRQDQAMAMHSQYLTEWFGLPLNRTVILSSLSLRDPQGAIYLVLVIGILAGITALAQRQPGPAILLIAAIYQSIEHMRMEALTACVVVVVGGAVLHAAFVQVGSHIRIPRFRHVLAISFTALFAILAGMNLSDIVTNRRYLIRNDVATFGVGRGWWFPESAAAFIERENLPGEILNTYDQGGFLLWRLGEHYRDFIDGRALPFGTDIFDLQQGLMQAPLDSPPWQDTANRYNINVFVLPLSRLHNTPLLRLRDFCGSRAWRPVYLDEVSAVFLRRTPQTEDLIRRSEVDCATASVLVKPLSPSSPIAFNQWANAAAVLASIGRADDALAATNKAMQIFGDSGYVHWLRGNIFAGTGHNSEAEEEFLQAIALDPSEGTLYSLSGVYLKEGRSSEAAEAMERAVRLSFQPHLANLRLAHFYLKNSRPNSALRALDEALSSAPAGALAETGGNSLRFQVARSRAAAWSMAGNLKQAIGSDQEAIYLEPNDPETWDDLAKLYEMNGMPADQARAQKRAADLVARQNGSR